MWLPPSASLLNKMDLCILVAHSYGGAVITEAGTDPSVAGLVYIAAHMPDAGENEADDGKRFPSDLSKSGAIKKTADGFTYLAPAQFHEYFRSRLSASRAAFMARSQVPNFADNFQGSDHYRCMEKQTGHLRSRHESGLLGREVGCEVLMKLCGGEVGETVCRLLYCSRLAEVTWKALFRRQPRSLRRLACEPRCTPNPQPMDPCPLR